MEEKSLQGLGFYACDQCVESQSLNWHFRKKMGGIFEHMN